MKPISLVMANIESHTALRPALIALFIIAGLLFAVCIAFTILCVYAKRLHGPFRKLNRTRTFILTSSYIATALTLVFAIISLNHYQVLKSQIPTPSPNDTSSINDTPKNEEPQAYLDMKQSEEAKPSKWGVNWEIFVGGNSTKNYNRDSAISFADPLRNQFFALPGISTFRGDNFRTGAAYGTVNVVNNTLTPVWEKKISSMPKVTGTGYWTGCGWTGQPLIVEWDNETRQIMNLYPEKKAKEGLIEVIYATLDGHIYFYDLDDGSYTRDPMNVGMAFKGAGSLDPRGYPIMYVGSGDSNKQGNKPRMFVISLIDCEIMYEHGYTKSLNFRNWCGYDSSPLVHGDTDTIIWPGENGLLYTIKLNTKYDKLAGTISVSPDKPVITRYKTSQGGTIGYESSAVVVENYAYIADNSGMLFCVDLNTMKLAWAQNVHDDTNATPVFTWENGKGYLYTGTSMERANGTTYITKLDASSGAVVWEKKFTDIYYDKAVSGGVLGSPVLGKKGTDLEGLIVYPIARTPGSYNGLLVALNIETGEVVWEKTMKSYSWSSPVAIYNSDGKSFIILFDSTGNGFLIDGKTGDTLGTTTLGSNVEASPAVFNNMLVVGTRGQYVYGVKIE